MLGMRRRDRTERKMKEKRRTDEEEGKGTAWLKEKREVREDMNEIV